MDILENLVLALQNKLVADVPTLQTIDLDWGQLEDPENGYPVVFPCVLVDMPSVQHEHTGLSIQPGTATVTVKTAVQITGDTHPTSGQAETSLQALRVQTNVHTALNLYNYLGFTKLLRRTTRNYNLPGGVKVREVEYETVIND